MTNIRADKSERKHGLRRPIASILIGALVIWVGTDLYSSNYLLEKQEIILELDGLPSNFDGFTIAHLSDLHQKSYGVSNHHLLYMIELAKADMIAITGDLIDKPKYLSYAEELCAELVKLAPVYYVTGNHEWGGKVAPQLKNTLKNLGVNVIDGKIAEIERYGQKLFIAGLEDPNGRADSKTAQVVMDSVRQKDSNAFTVLLSHRYEKFSQYKAAGANIALTGHAHGGLVRLPFTDGLIAPGRVFLPKHTSGAYAEGGTTMVTSRGLAGAGGIAPRLFNRPDVPVIKLKVK